MTTIRLTMAQALVRFLAVRYFWLPKVAVKVMEAIGFVAVTVERQCLRYQQNLRVWLDTIRCRDTRSQLLAIPDAAYKARVRRLERELADRSAPMVRMDHLCFVRSGVRSEPRID